MTIVKSIWTSIQGDPVVMRRMNGWLTILWIVMIPISLVTHWVTSVVYVSALSLWALVSGHWSAWQAARVEVAQQQEARRHEEEDIPRDVVAELVRTTTIEPDSSAGALPSAEPDGSSARRVGVDETASRDRG